MQFHHLFPSGKGFYNDIGRDGTMSIDDYFRHLVQLSHAGFRRLFCVQFLYNFKIRLKLWEKIRLQSNVKMDGGESCMVAFSKIPQEDISKLITYYELKQKAQKNRTRMPAEPVNVHKFTKRFLKNIKCVSALVPNSMESATNNRNLYNAMLAWLGNPDAWITANPNNKLNPIVLYLSTGKIFKFGDLSYLQKTTTCGNSPGTNSLHFLEFWKNLCEKVLGIDPKTMRPTKAGGILPRVRHAANAFEEDGNASLHCHILVWFFSNGSFTDNFNKFLQCRQHQTECGYRNPAWRFGFFDKNKFAHKPIPGISHPLTTENDIILNKSDDEKKIVSENKLNVSDFKMKPKSSIALEMKDIYLHKKQSFEEKKIDNNVTDIRDIKQKFISTQSAFEKILADELQCPSSSVKRNNKPLLTIDDVLRNVNEAKNDYLLAETLLNIRPLTDNTPPPVTHSAMGEQQS